MCKWDPLRSLCVRSNRSFNRKSREDADHPIKTNTHETCHISNPTKTHCKIERLASRNARTTKKDPDFWNDQLAIGYKCPPMPIQAPPPCISKIFSFGHRNNSTNPYIHYSSNNKQSIETNSTDMSNNILPQASKRTSNYSPSPSAKRRRVSHANNIANLLGPSRASQSAVLPRKRPARPEMALASPRQEAKRKSVPTTTTTNEASSSPAPLPKLVDSPLSSENIEKALRLIDRNTKQKRNSFDQLLQIFHDLYRWSRLPNRDHRNFFRHEFVSELSGISRVMKFLKAHNMGDEFLRQLLQTELPFNE